MRIDTIDTLNTESKLQLLRSMDLGDPAGEQDRFLDECRIETIAFSDLLEDRKDLIIGPKGTGKSSLYTLFSKYLKGILLRQKSTIIIKGIAKVGAPIYTDYWDEFSQFTYDDFRNFWNILFLHLIYREFVKDKELFDPTKVQEFEQLCAKNRIPLDASLDDNSIIKSAISKTTKVSGKAAAGTSGVNGEISVEFDPTLGKAPPTPQPTPAKIKTREVLEYLTNYLDWYDKKIWVMLDQLDQAFERNSMIEKQALHALISEMTSFNSDRIKLKVFLREDVFELISEYKGIVNSDHLRMSDVLRWEEVELIRMLLKRLLREQSIRKYFASVVDDNLSAIDNIDMKNSLDIFYSFFPERAKKGAMMWDYLMRELSDGRGNVTPRDLIGFMEEVRDSQIKLIDAGGQQEKTFFTNAAVEKALDKISKKKLQMYIFAEFPYLSEHVSKLKMGPNKYTQTEIEDLFEKGMSIVKSLMSVGVIHRKSEGNYYWIAPLYQRGLEVIQKRQKKN